MNNSKIIGLLGGSFDPIHNGHLHIAQSVLDTFCLDAVHFIPNFQSPEKKQTSTSADDRIEMARLATKNHAKFIVNDIEIQRQGTSYTVDTLRSLKKDHPENKLAFIMGADAFNHFSRWHQYHEILTLCSLIVINRPSFSITAEAENNDIAARINHSPSELGQNENQNIFTIHAKPTPISSTSIRQHIANGELADLPLPFAVKNYINQHRLYRS